ncbi:MAG: protein kinase [Xanthomonadales bacterium]|nr:protein kinase [Xanthomonadales bacterium]
MNNRGATAPIEIPNYRIKRVLGRGGMSTVYLAEQQQPRRDVVIKLVAPHDIRSNDPDIQQGFLARLRKEGDIAARFNHQNLVTVHECGIVDDHYYLVMEYLGGGDLRTKMKTGIDPDEVVEYIRGIAAALGKMHELGMLHRDLKPENVLLHEDGHPVLVDFGIAKASDEVSTLTSLGVISGTPYYMSPEQFQNHRLDARSDLYALGILFYELLTGQRPFGGDNPMAIGRAHLNEAVPRLPSELAHFQPIIDRLLAKDPAGRYQDASEVITDLDHLRQGMSLPPGPRSASTEQITPPAGFETAGLLGELKRRRVLYTAGAYAVAAFAVTEMASFVFENFGAPPWADSLLAALFVAGFPVAMFLSWVFDIGEDGIVRSPIRSRKKRRRMIALAVLLLVFATGGLFYVIFPEDVAVPEPVSLSGPSRPASTLAVLPFANLTGSPEEDYLSEGLSNELRDQLGRVPGLNVKARGSSIAVLERTRDEQAMAAQLGVGTLVMGDVSVTGDTMRISVRIIDGNTGFQQWSASYDAETGGLLTIQQSIASHVVAEVKPELELAAPATDDVSAHELMLLARHYESQVRDADIVDVPKLRQAIDLYYQATEADPNSALAHSRLAGALLYLGDVEAAEKPLFEALSLNPQLSEVQYKLGLYLWRRDLPGVGDAYRRAVELDPNNANALEAYGLYVWHWGDTIRGGALLRRALEADPLTFARYRSYGFYLSMIGKKSEALSLIEKIKDLFPANPEAYLRIARMYHRIGELDQGIAWALKARDLGEEEAAAQTAEFYIRLGDFETARRLEPDPGVGLLYLERRYTDLVDLGEVLLFATNEVEVGRLLAFAHLALDHYEDAVRVATHVGQPDSALADFSDGNQYTGLINYADALNRLGQVKAARQHAQWLEEIMVQWIETDFNSAFPLLLSACANSILGRTDAALDRIARMLDTHDFPQMPVFRDSPCFEPFQNMSEYRAVLDSVAQRRAALRERLPATLEAYGVSP